MKVALFNDTSAQDHYGCYAVCSVIVNELAKHGHAPSFFWPVAQDWRTYKQQISNEKFDLVICNGEGTIHDSGNSASSLCELGRFCKSVLRVKCFLINASIFNISSEMAENLRYYDAIYARDRYTVEYLKSFGIYSEFMPDLSFFSNVSPPTSNSSNHDKITLVIDSVIRADSAALRQIAASSKYCKFIRLDPSATDRNYILQKVSYKIKTFKNRIASQLELQNGSLNYHAIYRQNLFGSKTESSFNAFINNLCFSDRVLTGRFHGLTLSLLMRKPVVATQSNTLKSEVLLRDIFGTANRIVTIAQAKQLACSDLIPPLSTCELTKLEDYIKSGRASMERNFRIMLETV